MKKMFIVAFVAAAFTFAACGGKKKPDNTMNTGSGSAEPAGSDMGSGAGSDGSAAAPAGSGS